MSLIGSYRMRLSRKRLRIRAKRKSLDLRSISDRTDQIKPADILLCCTQRNEKIRLPYFLKYYRQLGVNHFLFIDNSSTDGSVDYLADQPDVSVWHTKASYKDARFGVDWQNHLLIKYAHGHWVLTVDPDEFFVYPFCDTRPLRGLTDWLEASSIKSFGSMLLDMYPKGRVDAQPYREGQDPLEIARWFDSGNYTISRNPKYWNLWIQGGPRARAFFPDDPYNAPALNKIPLVKWDKRYVYVSSTHSLLPRGLNLVYDEWGGEKASGVLLHTKFLPEIIEKSATEKQRAQHFTHPELFADYYDRIAQTPVLRSDTSLRYEGWEQLQRLGLMSSGGW